MNNINALFPKEYRVKISQVEHDKAVQDRILYACLNCKTETEYTKIELLHRTNDLVLQVLSGNQQVEFWTCPACKTNNDISTTQIIAERYPEPNYYKVVPPCPVKGMGLQNRLGFHQKFSAWFYKYLEELEYQLGLYRIEYASQEDMENSEAGYVDDGKD